MTIEICGLASEAQIEDVCFEAYKFQAPQNTRFTNPIFNDINLILPVGTGKKSSLKDRLGLERNYTIYCVR